MMHGRKNIKSSKLVYQYVFSLPLWHNEVYLMVSLIYFILVDVLLLL